MLLQTTPHSYQRNVTGDQKIIGIDYSHLKALCRISGLKDSNNSQSTAEAHQDFMNSYQRIFLRPRKVVPRIPLCSNSKITSAPEKMRASDSQARGVPMSQAHGRQTQEELINHMIKALKKFPIERSQVEHHAIHKMLKVLPCLTAHLSRQELQQISSISIIETWERGQIIFGDSGFYLMLKGSVKPYTQETSTNTADQKGPVIGVGGCFGTLEPPDAVDSGIIIQCVLTQEACEILKISHSGYAKLRKDISAQSYALKESLIQGCHYYQHWPKLSIDRLANLIQMRNFPANHVLVKEGKVCPFVAYIREGECHILQDIGALMKPQEKKGSRIKFVVVGKLGPMESFGEVSILLNQPSPCSIVTATDVQVGVIQPESLKGLDSVSASLMLQTAQPTCGKLNQEEINKEYMKQERRKEWDHIKKQVLSDALFYNGILQGCGKWTWNRGPRKAADK